jgi:hypothetical protein
MALPSTFKTPSFKKNEDKTNFGFSYSNLIWACYTLKICQFSLKGRKKLHREKIHVVYTLNWGHAVAQLVEALRYKLEGRGFDSRWCHWNFSLK